MNTESQPAAAQQDRPRRMPVLFVGHGAPLIAIEEDRAASMIAWGARLKPAPRAVLVVSAHWEAPLSIGACSAHEQLVYDFGRGLPASLFSIRWPAPGAPELAERVASLVAPTTPRRTERGLDHGAWAVLMRLFPNADVPTLQLSMPASYDDNELVQLGRALAPLRDEGVLIVCSGNVVHNLGTLDPSETQPPPGWAVAFDQWVTKTIEAGDLSALTAWRTDAPDAALAHPTPEHLRPLFVAVGAGDGGQVSWPITGFEHGSTSRRSLQLD
jgi:4,5-DOPA dioxygenase extradiol